MLADFTVIRQSMMNVMNPMCEYAKYVVKEKMNQNERENKENSKKWYDKNGQNEITETNYLQTYVSMALDACNTAWNHRSNAKFKQGDHWMAGSLVVTQAKMFRMVIVELIPFLVSKQNEHLEAMKLDFIPNANDNDNDNDNENDNDSDISDVFDNIFKI